MISRLLIGIIRSPLAVLRRCLSGPFTFSFILFPFALLAAWWLISGLEHAAPAAQPYLAIGCQGEKPGEFQQPRGITGLADGTFVVVDRVARIQHFSADGRPLGVWRMRDSSRGNPKGLCALPNGNLLICDTHYGKVLETTVDGDFIRLWGTPGTGPAEFTYPLSAVADTRHGAVYIVEYGEYHDRVQKFTIDGKFVKWWGSFGSEPGQFQRPSGVAVDEQGNVYVADMANHRVQAFDAEGTFLRAFGGIGSGEGELRYPSDIACARDGLLYVVEMNNHRVSVFDCSGRFVRVIGEGSPNIGQFACPWSLTVDARGRLLVSDTGNHRVQIFDLAQPVAAAPDVRPAAH